MIRLAPLLALGLAGCWPYVPSTWDRTQITGQMTWSQYHGEYWTDSAPVGQVVLAWFEKPGRDNDPMDYLTTRFGCTSEFPVFEEVVDGVADPGVDEIEIDGPAGPISMDFGEGSIFFSRLHESDWDWATSYDLTAVETENAGTLEVVEMFRSPGELELDGPDMSGESISTYSVDDLRFTWNSSTNKADYVVLRVELTDADFETLEIITCTRPVKEGAVKLKTDEITDLADATGAFVTTEVVREAWSYIEGRELKAGARSVTTDRRTGYVYLGESEE